jgi:hypothetical protein
MTNPVIITKQLHPDQVERELAELGKALIRQLKSGGTAEILMDGILGYRLSVGTPEPKPEGFSYKYVALGVWDIFHTDDTGEIRPYLRFVGMEAELKDTIRQLNALDYVPVVLQ